MSVFRSAIVKVIVPFHFITITALITIPQIHARNFYSPGLNTPVRHPLVMTSLSLYLCSYNCLFHLFDC